MKLHLGCGTNYMPGWVNIDFDAPKADLKADLRQALPYGTASGRLIFNEHFIEHITREEGLAFLKECRRVLKPGGILRVSTPDLRWIVAQYVSGNLDEWADVAWIPSSACRLLNEGLHSWGHQFVYDLPELVGALNAAGFVNVRVEKHQQSSVPELVGLECRPWHRELIVEAS